MTGVIGCRILRRDVVGSTMDEVGALAATGAPEGTVVVAREQTAGRGRAGRGWQSPAGTALLFSVLLRPVVPLERLSTFALVAAVGVAEAIERQTRLAPLLKWPNDVWLDGCKVAGILVSSRIEGETVAVVLGIGLNVNQTPEQLPEGAVSLRIAAEREQDVEALFETLLDGLNREYRQFVEAKGRVDLERWRSRAALMGERVTIEDGGVARAGVFEGVDEVGALLLRANGGEVVRVVAGDLTRGPRRNRESIRGGGEKGDGAAPPPGADGPG